MVARSWHTRTLRRALRGWSVETRGRQRLAVLLGRCARRREKWQRHWPALAMRHWAAFAKRRVSIRRRLRVLLLQRVCLPATPPFLWHSFSACLLPPRSSFRPASNTPAGRVTCPSSRPGGGVPADVAVTPWLLPVWQGQRVTWLVARAVGDRLRPAVRGIQLVLPAYCLPADSRGQLLAGRGPWQRATRGPCRRCF